MSEDFPDPILQRLEALSGQLVQVADRLAQVADAGAATAAREGRTRKLALGLVVSFVLDIALTVVVTLLSLSALSQSTTLHASQLSSCAISNETRVQQIQLWDFLLQLSGGTESAKVKTFLAFVDRTFAPVDCAKVYKT